LHGLTPYYRYKFRRIAYYGFAGEHAVTKDKSYQRQNKKQTVVTVFFDLKGRAFGKSDEVH